MPPLLETDEMQGKLRIRCDFGGSGDEPGDVLMLVLKEELLPTSR